MVAKLLTIFYSLLGAGMAFSYVPQVVSVWREQGRAEALSLAAWAFWATFAGIATLYGLVVLRDWAFTLTSAAGFAGSGAVTAIILVKRLRGTVDSKTA
jgi:hypothetical protein